MTYAHYVVNVRIGDTAIMFIVKRGVKINDKTLLLCARQETYCTRGDISALV